MDRRESVNRAVLMAFCGLLAALPPFMLNLNTKRNRRRPARTAKRCYDTQCAMR